jgi:hypothetical protein
MEALSRAGGLVAGERRVQVAAGNVGELAPAAITVATEKVSEARTARRATGNRLMASSPCLVSPFGLMSDDATTLLPPGPLSLCPFPAPQGDRTGQLRPRAGHV